MFPIDECDHASKLLNSWSLVECLICFAILSVLELQCTYNVWIPTAFITHVGLVCTLSTVSKVTSRLVFNTLLADNYAMCYNVNT